MCEPVPAAGAGKRGSLMGKPATSPIVASRVGSPTARLSTGRLGIPAFSAKSRLGCPTLA
jgi:hypothetical protein